MSKTHGGKGDLRRPLVVSEEEFTNSWDRIFGNKEKKMLEDAMDSRCKELMNEVKELIGKKDAPTE